jgi:hypothetical protein
MVVRDRRRYKPVLSGVRDPVLPHVFQLPGWDHSSIAVGIVAEPASASLFEPYVQTTALAPVGAGGIIASRIINHLHLTHGEQTPTYLGVERPKFVVRYGATPLYRFVKLMRSEPSGIRGIACVPGVIDGIGDGEVVGLLTATEAFEAVMDELEDPLDAREDRTVPSTACRDTVGYRHVTGFDTPGCRGSSRAYSRQYDWTGIVAAPTKGSAVGHAVGPN